MSMQYDKPYISNVFIYETPALMKRVLFKALLSILYLALGPFNCNPNLLRLNCWWAVLSFALICAKQMQNVWCVSNCKLLAASASETMSLMWNMQVTLLVFLRLFLVLVNAMYSFSVLYCMLVEILKKKLVLWSYL